MSKITRFLCKFLPWNFQSCKFFDKSQVCFLTAKTRFAHSLSFILCIYCSCGDYEQISGMPQLWWFCKPAYWWQLSNSLITFLGFCYWITFNKRQYMPITLEYMMLHHLYDVLWMLHNVLNSDLDGQELVHNQYHQARKPHTLNNTKDSRRTEKVVQKMKVQKTILSRFRHTDEVTVQDNANVGSKRILISFWNKGCECIQSVLWKTQPW